MEDTGMLDATSQTQTRMSITDFGDALIRTRDLDPVYVAIYGAQLPCDQLCRLLLAYWCFYHLGAAAWISNWKGSGYWAIMYEAAENKTTPQQWINTATPRWPRAAERRHFRGAKCIAAVQWLQSHSDRPEDWVERLSKYTEAEYVMNQVQTWPMFGPWIAFKAADMLERCGGAPINFNRDIGLMYEEPRKGLEMYVANGTRLVVGEHDPNTVKWHYEALLSYFSKQLAPPGYDRSCGPQEVETVLCKWESHMNGHYQIGKDIHEVRYALVGWGETAERLLAACPKEVIP